MDTHGLSMFIIFHNHFPKHFGDRLPNDPKMTSQGAGAGRCACSDSTGAGTLRGKPDVFSGKKDGFL
jgi:hypothetical protein